MKKSIPIAVLCSIVIVQSAARAQSPLEADAIAFRGKDTSSTIVKLFYGVIERALAFKQNGANWAANISGRAEVWQNGKAITAKEIHDTVRHTGSQKDIEALGANKILGAVAFDVPYAPQTIAALLWQRGVKSGQAVYDTLAIPLTQPDRSPLHVALGGIELASSADKTTGSPSPFEEAGVVLLPNPSGVFGDNYTKLYYYTELYIPSAMKDPSSIVQVVASVVDPSGKELLSSTTKHELLGEAIPVVGAIDIDGLPGDAFKLRIRVRHDDAVVAEAEKQFFFTSDLKLSEEAPSPAALDENAIFASSPFGKLTDAEADEQIAQALVIGTDADRKSTKSLTDLGTKQSFLYQFWRKQDASINAAKPLDSYTQFERRVDSVNTLYRHMKTAGWKTSRGRVVLKYGFPPGRGIDETHRVGTETKPYIIWQYDETNSLQLMHGETRPTFVFVDRQGGGDFMLVHSNVTGETYNDRWYSQDALRLAH